MNIPIISPLINSLQHSWNAFTNKDPTDYRRDLGYSSSYRPDRFRTRYGYEKSFLNNVINRFAVDAASVKIEHVRTDSNGRYLETLRDTPLQKCLTLSANIDQTGRAFRQDVYQSMLDEGVIAVVPIDTSVNPETGSYKIYSMRVGKIKEWFPKYVRVEVYNEKTGQKEERIFSKESTAIVENPFYSIMNEPNSTLQRLARKQALLDSMDEQAGSGRLDIVIQLPYQVQTELQRKQAIRRRADLEDQLHETKYGIAYIDSTEKITQLNRPINNQLLEQIDTLTKQSFSQLGITEEIMNGTADEKAMLAYYNRITEPIISAFVDDAKRKFISKTAIAQNQSIMFFREPFKLSSPSEVATMSDSLTRNAILSANEVRQFIGVKPVMDPAADVLSNKNLNMGPNDNYATTDENPYGSEADYNQGYGMNSYSQPTDYV